MFRWIFCAFLLFAAAAGADTDNRIPFHTSVDLQVGQSMIVHGYRGECGKRPAKVDKNRTRDTKLGVLSIGKWGVTKSRRCGGWTPAVEIIFTARRKGRETIEVAGENIKVRVR
ncbi:hypothetical protein [Roseobacter sp. S98]|uniref:hypothetical protein n=1 Tax=Roseobacter algicola (ex Choi et al. 2025) (nom. illeg.) TaxID=3092138 RepID=UPI003F517455